MTMEEVRFQIREYEGAKWGEFSNLDEAEEAYLLFIGDGDRKLGIEFINAGEAPEPVEMDDHRSRQIAAILALHESYHREAQLPLPHFLFEPAMVAEKTQRRPLIAQRMESLLKEACNELQIPHPIYRGMSKIFRDGRILHCHLAAIVPPGSSKALVQFGRFFLDAKSSKEDAARLCIQTLRKHLKRPVCDYNYDLLQDLHKKHVELEEDYKGLESKIRSITNSTINNEENVFDLDNIDHAGKGLPTSSSSGGDA